MFRKIFGPSSTSQEHLRDEAERPARAPLPPPPAFRPDFRLFPYDTVKTTHGGTVQLGRSPYLITRGGGYSLFTRQGDPPVPESPYGWKLHVSTPPESVPAAWDAISPYLGYAGVDQFKVRPDIPEGTHDRSYQPGKGLVIYKGTSGDRHVNWPELLYAAHQALMRAGVPPGPRPTFRDGDKILETLEPQIPGSQYFYAANDARRRKEIEKLAKTPGRLLTDSPFSIGAPGNIDEQIRLLTGGAGGGGGGGGGSFSHALVPSSSSSAAAAAAAAASAPAHGGGGGGGAAHLHAAAAAAPVQGGGDGFDDLFGGPPYAKGGHISLRDAVELLGPYLKHKKLAISRNRKRASHASNYL